MAEQNTKTIKIFLASSEELDYDRNAFGNLIRRLDNLYEKRGIRIKLFEWEDYDSAYNDQRKQNEYNEKVRESDIFLVMFHKKAGQFTIEEFNVATEQFKEKASPKIFAFCKDIKQDEEESEELKAFKKQLFDEMGHYWCRYDSRESLQFQFVMQLQLVESEQMSDLKVENGNVTLDGIHVAPLDKLRFAAENEDYMKMCQELSLLPEKIEKARLRLEKYPDDDDLADDLQQKLDQYNQLKKEVENYRQLLFGTAKRIAQMQGLRITERMRRAMDAFNEGKAHDANIILDEAEHDARMFLEEFKRSKEITEQMRQAVLNSIQELRLKAGTVMSDASHPIEERIAQTRQIYALTDEMAHAVDYDKEKYGILLLNYAMFLDRHAYYKDAITIYQRLIELAMELHDMTKLYIAYNGIGLAYYEMGNYSEALKCLNKAMEIHGKVTGLAASAAADTLNNIGLVYNSLNDTKNATEYYMRALEIREKVLGPNHPDTAQSYNNLGLLYETQNKYDKALKYHQRALEIRERTLGKEHPDTAASYRNIGLMHIYLGQASKGLEFLQKALEISEKTLGKKSLDVACIYSQIGYAYNTMGRHKDALPYHQTAVGIIEKLPDLNNNFTANIYSFIGWTYETLQEYPNALKSYQKMLAICEKAYGPDHEFTKMSKQKVEAMKLKTGEKQSL